MTIFAHRPAEPRDLPMIVDGWCDSYALAYAAGLSPMGEYIYEGVDHGYRAHMVAVVYGLLARAEVLVAYRPGLEEPHDLAGFICFEREVRLEPRREVIRGRWTEVPGRVVPLVHYVYVKLQYRREKRLGVKEGVATGLFRAAGIDLGSKFAYTAKTSLSAQLQPALAPAADFKPLLARFPNPLHEAQKTKPVIPRGEDP